MPAAGLIPPGALAEKYGAKIPNKDGTHAFAAKELRALLEKLPDRTA